MRTSQLVLPVGGLIAGLALGLMMNRIVNPCPPSSAVPITVERSVAQTNFYNHRKEMMYDERESRFNGYFDLTADASSGINQALQKSGVSKSKVYFGSQGDRQFFYVPSDVPDRFFQIENGINPQIECPKFCDKPLGDMER